MQKLYRMIQRVANSTATILIQGESGTGKELIARAIHDLSSRKEQPLIPVNCGAIPEDLLESELFGHVRGAFTGAASTRIGRFELAHNGTLFLDEIGDMSPKLQVKMLRVLQEKVVEPVGAVKTVKVDVRVIAATHKNLEKEVAESRFREDLFYRLNVVPIHVPPLRDRSDDIPLLVDHFLNKFAEIQGKRVHVDQEILDLFIGYRWPGNVRELENLIERLTVLSDGHVHRDDIPEKILFGSPDSSSGDSPAVVVPDFGNIITNLGEGVDFNQEVDSFENQLILSALDSTGWNKNKAAQLLNLNRTTLVEKIKKKGLERMEG